MKNRYKTNGDFVYAESNRCHDNPTRGSLDFGIRSVFVFAVCRLKELEVFKYMNTNTGGSRHNFRITQMVGVKMMRTFG